MSAKVRAKTNSELFGIFNNSTKKFYNGEGKPEVSRMHSSKRFTSEVEATNVMNKLGKSFSLIKAIVTIS